jgi:phosphatidylinositol alpha 1,6-mannosyltransferase
VSNSVIRTATLLDRLGHKVLIVAPDKYTANFFQGIPVKRIKSVEVPGIHATDLALPPKVMLTDTFTKFRPDVIHLASPFMLGNQAAKVAQKLGIPIVAVFQTDISGFATHYGLTSLSGWADKVIYKLHKRANINLVPSSASAKYLQSLGLSNIRQWGRGVDLEMFNPKWRSRPYESTLRIGYLGRLAPEKNIHMLAGLADLSDIELEIIGDGPERSRLSELMPTANFRGQLGGNDLSQAVANFDILIAPGEKETFCQVVQEGMSAAVAVIAPAIGGPVDLIESGIDGFLYEPGSAADLREIVERLIADRGLLNRLRDAAWLKMQNRSWENIVLELVDHYSTAVDKQKVQI